MIKILYINVSYWVLAARSLFSIYKKYYNIYYNIAAASILAKVYHDEYITELCELEPELKIYEWQKNMCYGTKNHLMAIEENGISKYHRKTFGICKEYA